jgi:tetratricopeptide (TPR) repeat protein
VSQDSQAKPPPFTVPVRATFQQPLLWQQPRQQPPAAAIHVKFREGLALHQQGRLIEAERFYREVLEQAPTHFDTLHFLGVLALQTLRTESGIELIEKAIALNPNSFGAYNNLGLGLRDLRRFDAALECFDKALALKPSFAEAHNGRGITLRDLKRPPDALASLDEAIVLKPDYAEAHNNRGVVLRDLKRLDDTLASFTAAIRLKPDYVEAYTNRGKALQDMGRFADALVNFDRAVALRPDDATAWCGRGLVLQDLGRLDDALASFDRAVTLKPDYPEAYNNRGIALQELRRRHEAIASFDKAVTLRPNYAEAYNNQSLCLLQEGHFEQGFRLYEWRKKLEEPVGNRSFPQPLWLGQEDISHKTLFVHWEQGLGDTILFSRFGALLKAQGAKVVMSVQEPLYRLFAQMKPHVEIIHEHEVPAEFDYQTPLMSLPLALRTTVQTIPSKPRYIFADEELRSAWSVRLPPKTKPRIGIVWSTDTKRKSGYDRSIDLTGFLPLLSADVHWISLQKETNDADAALLREHHQIVSYHNDLRDFADTAALIDHLDLVITIDTSVAHLAGAMGKPVWIMLPYNADWKWLLDRDDTPWYPTARLFRRDDPRSWGDMIAQVAIVLRDFTRQHS